MARAYHHGGGQTSDLTAVFGPPRPDATPRTGVIWAYTGKIKDATGELPSPADVAQRFRLPPAEVERHYQILGWACPNRE